MTNAVLLGSGFALLLKHYSRYGRFPRGRSNVPDTVERFVGRQLGADSSELNLYEWSGRTIEYHRAQIRTHLRFRVATVDDQEKLTTWLAARRSILPAGSCPSAFSGERGHGRPLYCQAATIELRHGSREHAGTPSSSGTGENQ